MSTATYMRLEVLRMVRDTRFFIFSLVVPLVLFFVVAGANRDKQLGGISFALYYMVGMASWGCMAAVVAGGSRIAVERSLGWTRQMRITPLSTQVYFASKAFGAYVMALVTLVLLYAAGGLLGVRLPTDAWLRMTGLLLIGLVPFAVLGVLLGHVLNAETMGPAVGGIVAAFALLGGVWGPLATTGTFHNLLEDLPSYWLVQAGRVSLQGHWWPGHAWMVLAAWTFALGFVAVRAYRRDTGRV